MTKWDEDRFVTFIEVDENECWLWTGCKSGSHYRGGYGSFAYGGHKKKVAAHRWAYEYFLGQNPGHLVVCHACDVPSCVNPFHLFLGTLADNARDMISKGRNNHQKKTHCKHGHPFSEENTIRLTGKGTKRRCQICERKRHLRHYVKNKENILARNQKHYWANKGRINKRHREYYWKNREKISMQRKLRSQRYADDAVVAEALGWRLYE